MNDSPVTNVETPKGQIVQIVVTKRLPAQKKGIFHFVGFIPKSDSKAGGKFSVTGTEI